MRTLEKRFVVRMMALVILISSVMAIAGADRLVAQTQPFELRADDPSNNDPTLIGAADAPEINLWYGQTQTFGTRNGKRNNPQTWVNILGNISPATGITSLSYTLNGGPSRSLAWGPDGERLYGAGDFNAQIAYNDLNAGNNAVLITAANSSGSSQQMVTVIKSESGAIWTPGAYVFDWGTAGGVVTNLAQPVDGPWKIIPGGVGPSVVGYDRLLAIGDLSWRDYTITVPVTVKSMGPAGKAPGVGMIVRWNGHEPSVSGEEPPYTGWHNIGALAWYRIRPTPPTQLELVGARNWDYGKVNFNLDLNVTYMFKVEVKSSPAAYRFKVWRSGESEPPWMIEKTSGINSTEPKSGSLLLLAHYVDAVFGNVQVQLHSTTTSGGNSCTLTVTTAGEGSVTLSPNQASYPCGTLVTLQAIPAPGHRFIAWSNGATGTTNPVTVNVNQNTSVLATFEPIPMRTLAIDVDGAGQVTISPLKDTYQDGEVVTLTAVPGDHSHFAGWSGDVTGTTNPLTVVMNSNKQITAGFEPDLHTLTINIPEGGGLVIIDPPGSQFSHGTQVRLTAEPDRDFAFQGWGGAATGKQNPYWLTIDDDTAIYAFFNPHPGIYYQFLPGVMNASVGSD